jgi:hypothetical protein
MITVRGRAPVLTLWRSLRREGIVAVPQQNPMTRIELVARDLARLAEELGDCAGPDARTALLYWRRELLSALDEIERLGYHHAST